MSSGRRIRASAEAMASTLASFLRSDRRSIPSLRSQKMEVGRGGCDFDAAGCLLADGYGHRRRQWQARWQASSDRTDEAFHRFGRRKWKSAAVDAILMLQDVFWPTDTVIGGGNGKHVGKLPPIGQTKHSIASVAENGSRPRWMRF